MQLRVDHLILRADDAHAVMVELVGRAGLPVVAPVEAVGGLLSGVVRAGSVDVEVVELGAEPPSRPHGYGIGFVADVGLERAAGALRAAGLATSAPVRGVAGSKSRRRTWRAVQVHGLLPDPFPAPVATRRRPRLDRWAEATMGAVVRIPGVARAATRRPGRSMVVLTEYGFDVDEWRSSAGRGPDLTSVEIGCAGRSGAWGRLPLDGGVSLDLDDDGPAGIRRMVFRGDPPARDPVRIGDVELVFEDH